MVLGFYFSSPLKIGMGMGYPNFKGLGRAKSASRPVVMPNICVGRGNVNRIL
jgi:hypothetical protein